MGAETEKIKKEYEELLDQLSDPELISNWEKFEELTRRKSYLEKIIEKEKEAEEVKNRMEENRAILNSREDPELSSLAETETIQLSEKLKSLEEEIQKLLAEGGKSQEESSDPKAVIIEIRAGTGGEEAALFVTDLFKMYSKYAALESWQAKSLDSRPTSLNGFKEIVFEVAGPGVFSKLKNEAGVHRVQRIPTTEKSGRIHTSTVSVAVLPKPRKGKITISPNDLKVDTYKASGPGGQYVNKRMTAVRVTHLPTGLVVTSQTARNLQQNRENALSILEARLLEKKESEEALKMGQARRSQIGTAQRAEKIRTYNFPQSRVTDHRIKKSFHNLEEIMEGKLEPLISALQKLPQP
jgi:peptide chain release factor 1